jgi:XTP/dITP diphosphohydrolase
MGIDPVFLPEGETETFGEMAPERSTRSHRARAFAKLVDACFG